MRRPVRIRLVRLGKPAQHATVIVLNGRAIQVCLAHVVNAGRSQIAAYVGFDEEIEGGKAPTVRLPSVRGTICIST
jgi:hypothetical protein